MSDSDEPKAKPPVRPTPNVTVTGESKWDRALMGLVVVFIGQVVVFFTIIMWVVAWRFLVSGGCPQW